MGVPSFPELQSDPNGADKDTNDRSSPTNNDERIVPLRFETVCYSRGAQLEATGRENTEIQEAQSLQISELEEQLKVATEDKERLKTEGRKMKAHSKVFSIYGCENEHR